MVDVDYFKTINDTFGHLEGDNALVIVADTLKLACNSMTKRPFIARYGGDEFIIVVEGTIEEARQLCEEIKVLLAGHTELPYEISLRIGIGRCRSGMTPRELIAAADDELYKVKQNRDQTRGRLTIKQ